MCLARRVGLVAAVLACAGCGGGAGSESGSGQTYDYVTAVRPLAYDNARAACSGHSLTSLSYEYGTSGSTFAAAARSWARRNQPDARLRGVSFRGCLDALRETDRRPVLVAPRRLSADEIEVYLVEYATCRGLTIADLVEEYGLDPAGLTLEEVVRAVVRESFGEEYRDVAYDACLAAVRGEAPRYGS